MEKQGPGIPTSNKEAVIDWRGGVLDWFNMLGQLLQIIEHLEHLEQGLENQWTRIPALTRLLRRIPSDKPSPERHR